MDLRGKESASAWAGSRRRPSPRRRGPPPGNTEVGPPPGNTEVGAPFSQQGGIPASKGKPTPSVSGSGAHSGVCQAASGRTVPATVSSCRQRCFPACTSPATEPAGAGPQARPQPPPQHGRKPSPKPHPSPGWRLAAPLRSPRSAFTFVWGKLRHGGVGQQGVVQAGDSNRAATSAEDSRDRAVPSEPVAPPGARASPPGACSPGGSQPTCRFHSRLTASHAFPGKLLVWGPP